MKKTRIGGQAVIEGVMMRGATSSALAVRDENGEVRLETERLPQKKSKISKIPFVRGIVNLVTSMILGTKITMKSAEIFAEGDVDTSEDGKGFQAVMAFSLLLGLGLAIFLFVFLPTTITDLILKWTQGTEIVWLRSLVEGLLKLAILILYMSSITLMKDIKRLFMYHGAEHKTIACYENELPLTVENVRKCSRYHDRCGTSFIVFVVVISIALTIVLDIVFNAIGFVAYKELWVRILFKIVCLPLVAGISYEVLMLMAKSDFILFRPLKWFGKQFQRITTREPDDGMIEVAITSFNAVLEMDADQSKEAISFPSAIPLKDFREQVEPLLQYKTVESCDIDWILCALLGVKRSELKPDLPVPFCWQIRAKHLINRCAQGEPLQYVLGNTDFYGRLFSVNKDCLIPRFETELVCEQALKSARSNDKVLDLCCGSGAIGVTLFLEKQSEVPSVSVSVTCADISDKALHIAKGNAKKLKAKVNFVQSDMFSNIKGKYNLIVCNPPYIESAEIASLPENVKREPVIALDGGADGLDFYRILAEKSCEFLAKDGKIIMEIGYNQGESVKNLFEGKFDGIEVLKDYSGLDRIVIAYLKK